MYQYEPTNFMQQSYVNALQAVRNNELTVEDFYSKLLKLRHAENLGIDDGSTCTKDVMPFIEVASRRAPEVLAPFLCTFANHYATSYGDRGWGCGYRNFQMLVSSMCQDPLYAQQLDEGWGVTSESIPSVTRIQHMLDRAWTQGFDPQGRDQLGSRIANTRNWIGTTDIASMLGSVYVRCHIEDFFPSNGRGGGHARLFDWVLDYFSDGRGFKLPLFLQHQGHSRTIVGVEQLLDGQQNLLVLDPIHRPEQMADLYHPYTAHHTMLLIRQSMPDLWHAYYQVLAVEGIMSTHEYEATVAAGGPYRGW